MVKVDITLDNDMLFRLQGVLKALGESSLPRTSKAFNDSSKLIQKAWRSWAMGGKLQGIDNIKSPSPNLAASIGIEKEGNFNIFIGTDSIHAKRIQEGSPQIKMRDKYPYGNRSRVSKKGIPYLIIPFKWGTNNGGKGRAHFGNTIDAKSAAIIESRGFERTYTSGNVHIEKNFRGEDIARQEYQRKSGEAGWGDRLTTEDKKDYANGMVKMNSKGHSQYLTFRIISSKVTQARWERQAVKPIDVVGALKETFTPVIEEAIDGALSMDLAVAR